MITLDNKQQTSMLADHKSALVLGLGLSGYSVVRFLRKQGLDVVVMDSRAAPPKAGELAQNYPEVVSFFGGFDPSEIALHTLIIASPGIDLAAEEFKVARQAGAQFVGDIELFVQHNTQPLIVITGSNGKSTVTTLVGKMCESAGLKTLVAGNIGRPALDALSDGDDFDIAVLELSSFQLETTSSMPAQVAAILNISPDHLDRYASMGDYVLAKARILRGAERAVLPRHDDMLRQITNINEVYSFGLDEPDNNHGFGLRRYKDARWLVRGNEKLIRLRDIPLLGMHNAENVLSAFALVSFLELPNERLVEAVSSFKGLPHRMETVAIDAGITWVNDSKATNVGATSTALTSLENDVVWIAGGQGKGADFADLSDAIRANIKLLILFGEDADRLELALQDVLPIKRVANMQEAVFAAGEQANKGSVVLLSPACASFDMYPSFTHRGDDFRQHVNAWLKERAA